jgi:hypothetical protein
MKYQSFVFKRYEFDKQQKTLRLYYGFDDTLEFRETYTFNFDFTSYDPAALTRANELLFFMAGVSYYKAYPTARIIVKAGEIDNSLAGFLGKTYQNGLREFFFVNKLDPLTPVVFPATVEALKPLDSGNQSGQLIGLGGGKDSLMSVEVLHGQPHTATWSLNHRSQLEPLVERIDLPHYWVERELDTQLYELNKSDALNGHVPISAVFSCVGLIVSILGGFRDMIVSNESSASEPTMRQQGTAINHQYSKSLEYEQDFQACLSRLFGSSQRYYSLLRPLSELHIAELFAGPGFDKYKDVFSSCNRAYTRDQQHMSWCGECSKCAFVFLILTPFLKKEQVTALWRGKNLLLDPALETTYRRLLGIEGDKPFDCVGEIKEARTAMRLAQKIYPELDKYVFDIPDDYNFRRLGPHAMPPESYDLLLTSSRL